MTGAVCSTGPFTHCSTLAPCRHRLAVAATAPPACPATAQDAGLAWPAQAGVPAPALPQLAVEAPLCCQGISAPGAPPGSGAAWPARDITPLLRPSRLAAKAPLCCQSNSAPGAALTSQGGGGPADTAAAAAHPRLAAKALPCRESTSAPAFNPHVTSVCDVEQPVAAALLGSTAPGHHTSPAANRATATWPPVLRSNI